MPDSKNLLRNIAKRVQQGGSPFAITCRKARPTLRSNSGMRFPVGASSGKRVPEYRLKLGCGFPNGSVSETATRNIGSERDAVSQTGLKRKPHPSLRPQNGMQFPLGQP